MFENTEKRPWTTFNSGADEALANSPVHERDRVIVVLWGLLSFFFVLHFGMMVYDYYHPEVFLRADRALSRWQSIDGFLCALKSSGTAGYLASHGNPGDYVLQGIGYLLVGRMGLILFQVLLTLWSAYALFRVAEMVLPCPHGALVASGLYLMLPHSLILCHQLSSEAIHTPLLVISIWLLAKQVARGSMVSLVASALSVGVANLIRPVTLLWPLVCSGLMLKRTPGRALVFLAVAVFPVLAWFSFMLSSTGEFGMGTSSRDMGHNLYQRVSRISRTLPLNYAADVNAAYLRTGEKGKLSLTEYLKFVVDYPGPTFKHSARDLIVMATKSGVERITIDYLKVGDNELQRGRWRKIFEREGFIETLRFLWQTQGVNLTIGLLGAACMVILLGLACTGAVRLVLLYPMQDLQQRLVAGVLIALPLYIFIFSQLVNAAQSRHRAPAEAALAVLAVCGYEWLMQRFGRREVIPCS